MEEQQTIEEVVGTVVRAMGLVMMSIDTSNGRLIVRESIDRTLRESADRLSWRETRFLEGLRELVESLETDG